MIRSLTVDKTPKPHKRDVLRVFIGTHHKTTYLKLQAVKQLKGVVKHDSLGLFLLCPDKAVTIHYSL